ncbi:alpha-galactosidase [Dysgonomonas sp. 216]|uniref:alpha-galactosidase n=1 Tax=Dysgonomonas sp. 216 TaxID=2302934 RepID=UPI0013D19076|nr:alpha-galactosidase [Dysgonomonas sp. 216]NDW17618.1 alpha-galactosidase [Dysgonomonas sp. 216]
MKNYKFVTLLLLGILLFSCGNKTSFVSGKWALDYDTDKKCINITKDSNLVFNDLYPTYKLGERVVSSKDYSNVDIKEENINDEFGKGKAFKFIFTEKSLPTLTQIFYVYQDKDYVLTDFSLSSNDEIASNYMAPVNIDKMKPVLNAGSNRALFIPYDNDCWIRYQSHPLTFDNLTSYEVTAIFNNADRNGIVVGSIEHDNWKTGVKMEKGDENNIGSLVCYGGVADSTTRDSKPHGALVGKAIKSPKVLIGLFNDWRNGLEVYGDANAIVAPPKEWNKAMPFGWNSWGVLQFKLTYAKAMEVSDFFKEHLQNNNFQNQDGTIYVGLDSGWNSFSEDELKSFVKKCKENGQIAGIYWTPFTDWSRDPERTVGEAPEYKNKDIYVYANGKPQSLDGAYAIDPTHPSVEIRMKQTSELFRRCGFEYVKMDFMTHGAMEGDKWYKEDIQTGTQAYNYGMQLLNKYFGDMYLNLSISPIFPAHYAQSRRIACDAWNKIKDTEYTMNALSYGWWIDRVYQYNDADHIVLKDATEGENRARVTSAIITGLYIAGDDFSKEGLEEGKKRSVAYLTNAEINKIATGESFRPIDGDGEKSENKFIRKDGDTTYFVVFNYEEESKVINVPLERIGLDASHKYSLKDLWSGENLDLKASLVVPGKDVRLIKITK